MTSAEQWAWLAGIIEGEGSILPIRKINSRTVHSPRIAVGMTDEDVIRRCHAVSDAGHVSGPYGPPKSKPHWKPRWTWSVENKADVRLVLSAVLPMLGVRRTQQANDCLASIDALELSRCPAHKHSRPGYCRECSRLGGVLRVPRRGEKLTQNIADEIRTRLSAGEKVVTLAREYRVDRNTIGRVKNGSIWVR